MSRSARALERAKSIAGGNGALAQKLGITEQAVSQWDECPVRRVLDVERHTGVPRHELRPDIYPAPERARA